VVLTFEDVMAYDVRNIAIYRAILERYEKKGIVPFVGAGLSKPAGFKLWEDFLDQEYVALKREYPESMGNAEMPSGPLDKASELCDKMGLAGFHQTVVKAFGGKYSDSDWSPIIDRVQNEAVGLLPKLFHEVIVTTNFDRLLEQLYPKTLVSHPGHYSLLNDVLQKGLPRGTSLLLKLHGCVSDPHHLIFTRESYTKAYPEIGDTPFIIALETILTSQTVLFLGCSLKDGHTVKQWAKMLLQPRGEGRTHFAIISCEKNRRLEKRRDLGNMNIHPILYEKGNHDAVRVILERLYRDTNGGKPLSNIRPKNEYFTGREEQLEALKKDFGDDSHVRRVVSGLGGVGKTQVALEYAHRHLDEYADGVWWLNAENEQDLTNSCCEVLVKVGELDIAKADNIKPDELLNRWQYWLGEHRKRLLIFDNAESDALVERYISVEYRGHVLLTTRDASWSGEPIIGLPLMPVLDAREFLLKRTGRKEKCDTLTAVDDVAKRLGCLPLALEQAAAYMRNADWSFSGYLNMLADFGLSTIDKDKEYAKPDKAYYQEVVATTWKISFNKIKEQNNLVSELFNVFAYTGSNNIPLDIFVEHRELMLSGLQKIDKSTIVDAVALLRRYSLIERDGKDDYFISIHRLVQEVVRNSHKTSKVGFQQLDMKTFFHIKKQLNSVYLDCCFKVLDSAVPKEYSIEQARVLFKRVAKHAEVSAGYYENGYADNEAQKTVATTYENIGLGYRAIAQYSKALEMCKIKSLGIRERALGKKHPDIAASYNIIALICQDQGNYVEALEWNNKALAIAEKTLGLKHIDTASSYNNLATVYFSQGNYVEALGLFRKALAINEVTLGRVHPTIAYIYNNIASIYASQGDYVEALSWYHKALEIYTVVSGVDHPDTANSYNNIAHVYANQGDYGKALELHKKALGIHKRIFGKKHPNTATICNGVAEIYYRQSDYAKALVWFERALKIYEKVLGKDHPDTAASYHGLALVHSSQGDYAKARELFERALKICEKVLGKEHPNTAMIHNGIAEVYYRQCDYSRALEWFKKALVIREKVLGMEHPDTLDSYNNIAGVYTAQGEYVEALEWHKKASIYEKVLGKEHPNTATSYNSIANACFGQGDYAKALEWYEKALVICEKTLGKDHPNTAETCNNIAGAYDSKGDYAKAIEWYEKALIIYEKVLGKEHPNTATSYNNIALVSYHQGSDVKALEWFKKALVIREKVLGKDHLDTAYSYNGVALVYLRQGNYAKALEWFEKALVIREKTLGKDHPNTAGSYNDIAIVYSQQGEYVKALEGHKKALVIREKTLGKDHPKTADSYNNIAAVYYRQGDYAKALEWFEKALVIREKVLGKENPDTAVTYNNLAEVYSRQGEYVKALEWFEKALVIREKVLGVEHPNTAGTYDGIAEVHCKQGEYVEALEWYTKALTINEAVFGKGHPSTAETYDGIAKVCFGQGDYVKALEWHKKALVIREKVLGKEHPSTATTCNNIALVYAHQGNYQEALEWYMKALAISEKVLGKEHPNTVSIYNNIARIYDNQRD
jgi:tetratricopeptide (TPR) repeat protein